MGMTDWVPVVNYGDEQTLPGSATTYFILYPLPDYIADQEFLYEDDVTTGLFLHRVVGNVNVAVDGEIVWRLMPLGCNYDLLSVLEPFSVPFSGNSPEWANLRWWDERRYGAVNDTSPSLVDHPYWTQVDVKPRQAFGQKRNLWPVLAVRNSGLGDGRIRIRLRMLIS